MTNSSLCSQLWSGFASCEDMAGRGREHWEEELRALVTTGQQLQAQWTLEVHAGQH